MYHEVPVERTIEDLYDGSLDDTEIADFISANIEAAQKEYNSVVKKAPKISTDKSKYLQEKQAYQEEVGKAKAKVDYWQAVENERQHITHTSPEELKNAEDELSGEAARKDYRGITAGDEENTTSVEDLVRDFLGGAKITPEDFRKETGLSISEQKKFVGMISKQGKTIARLGEELADYDEWNLGGRFFDGDSNAARGAIIDALLSSRTRGDFKQQDATEEEERYIEAVEQQREQWYYENYHMTYEEYLQYREIVLPELLRKYANFAPDILYPQFVASFEDAYAAEHSQTNNTENNEQQRNDTTAEEPTTTPGDTVLQTEETNNSRGDSQSKEQPTEVPTDVRSSNENGTLPQSTPTEVESETDYTLSDKKAENRENFYQDANGNIDLANIPEEVFDKIGKPKAPLRLTPSMLKHVFDRHGKEMGLSPTDDAIDFILDVMDNFDHVRQGDKNAVIFSIENGRSRTGRRAVTILLNSESGEYYGIKTSGYERIEGLNKKPLLWEKGANETSATGAAPANVTTEQTQQGSEPAGSASNHSNGSIGKDTQSSQTKQEKEDKFVAAPRKDGESITDYAERVAEEHQAQRTRKEEEAKVDTNPTDAQKEAGNYKKGHIKVDGLNITIEQPKGSIRRGTDANGKQWESEMHNTYGYIRGTESVDGDHIDIFLSDNPTEGNVFVVDQINKDGSFDEHKVMYGFPDMESAKRAYLSNYEEGWQGLGNITEVSKEDFKAWIDSSKRKTKPFAEYTSVKTQDDTQTKKPTEENAAPANTQSEENNAHNSEDIMHEQKNVQLQQAINAYENATKFYYQQLKEGKLDKVFENKQWKDVLRKQTELQKALLQLNSEELKELLKQTTNEDTKKEIKGALDAVLRQEQRSIEYNAVLDKQEPITPIYKEEKKPIAVTEFVETDKKEAEIHPVLTGVYHDNGYVVGTNAHILLARKEDYNKSLEGKITNKKGEVIDGKYPNWRAVVEGETTTNSWGINLDELHAFVRGVLAKLKADGAKKSTIDSATIAFKDTDGKIIVCDAKTLDKALRGAKSIGATEFGNKSETFAHAQTKKGYVVCPTISTYHSINDNCFVYAPKEAARQQTTATLTNDTEAKQKATEAVLAALSKAGIEVVRATDEEVKALLSNSHATTLRTPQGTIYGWSVNGKIYLTEAGINPDTPIHEYTHLWADAMMKQNKQGWNSIKSLLKDTPVWKEVIADPNYSNIKDNEDAVASEVLSRISGKKNAAKMEEEAQRAIDEAKGVFEKAEAATVLLNLKRALKQFWHWVGKNVFGIKDFKNIDEVTDRVLYDLLSNTKLNSGTVTTVDGVSLPSRINVVEAEANHGFKNFDDGRKWAKENIARTYDNEETNGKGNIRISNTAIDKFMSEKAVAKSESKDVHMAVLKVLPDIIRESVDAEQHEDRIKDENGIRKAGNTVNPDVMIHRLYGAVDIAGKIYRVKVTLKENVRTKETSKAYSYEATKIELLSGQSGDVTMTSPRNDNNSILTAKLLKDIEKSYGKGVKLLKDDKSSDPRFQIVGNSLSDEEKKIVETAKANDTYMKAPNGKPTNLSEKQWTQVRTTAFKNWFGDWEKAARIEKVRRSKAVVISGSEYKDKYELNRDSAKEWIKDNLRGEYTIADTEEIVSLTKVGANKVTSHGMSNKAHLQSIAAIPQLIRHAIFIEERPNEKHNNKYDSYKYYICGLKIGTTDYTVKLTIGVKSGKKYYDHALTEIEKGKLLDRINDQADKKGFTTTGDAPLQSYALSIGKDSKLLSILQTNSSKVVDENGEPMVVYHGTLADGLRQFSTDFIGSRYSYDEKGFFFISNRKIADDYAVSEFDASRRGEVIDAYVSLGNPLVVNSEWCRKNGLGSNVFKDNDVIEFWDNYQSLIVEESEQNDGVIVTDGETSMVVAFFPNQIKSATGNNGNFSTTEDDILYRTVFGGNSGYVGYSMSKRAAEAKEEGRYPKTEFRREYHITAKSLDMLTSLGFIDNSEWHHTSMYGNKTPFYGWAEDEFADDYLKHKKEVDTLCKGIDPKTKQPLIEKVEKPQYEHEYEMPQYGEAETAANPIREWRHKQIEKYDQFTGFKGYADATEEEKKERDAYLHSLNEQMEEKIREMLAKDYPDYLAAKNALDAYNNYEEDLRKAIGEHIKEYLDIDKYSQRWREQTATTQPTTNTEELTNHAESVVQNLHLNNVEIVPDGSSLNGEQATAKGFYNKRTGKIVVVVSNHTDIADIEKTVLHEAVAHHGLRELFGDNFDNFLDTVFAKADIETRQQIAHLSAKHGWNIRTATEEYLASMAEDTNFEQIEPTLWQRIKQLFGEIMSAFGLHHANITDNDLRYILWHSYKNLQNSGKHSILDIAENIAMQYRLKVGNYTDKFTDELNAVNERFNEELSNLTEENADKVTLWLGKPSKVLLAAGVEDKPMKLYGNKVIRKMKKHGFSLEELRDLPRAVADPVAVFNNYQREGNRSILTELKTQQGNFLVSVNIGKDADINFNIVRSVFGKGNENVVAWINNGLATYINKEKALSFLSHQSAPIAATAANAGQESSSYLHLSAPIAEAAENSELSSAAKIIKDFHNPKLNSNVLYRSSIDPTATEVLPDARTRYEEETKEPDNIGSVPKTHNFFRRFYKSYIDSMLALKSFTNSVLEATGDKMASHEDTYKAENAMTSKNKTDGEVYNPLFPYMPLYLYM